MTIGVKLGDAEGSEVGSTVGSGEGIKDGIIVGFCDGRTVDGSEVGIVVVGND